MKILKAEELKKIPIRWAPKESVVGVEREDRTKRQIYSRLSDVWSYGTLLWEIWSQSGLPWKKDEDNSLTNEVLIFPIFTIYLPSAETPL